MYSARSWNSHNGTLHTATVFGMVPIEERYNYYHYYIISSIVVIIIIVIIIIIICGYYYY